MLGVAVVVTEPLELLSNVLQHRDATGFAVNEILSKSGILEKCSEHLFLLLQPADHPYHTDRTDWPADLLLYHFGWSDELANSLVAAACHCASCVASLVTIGVFERGVGLEDPHSGDGQPLCKHAFGLRQHIIR